MLYFDNCWKLSKQKIYYTDLDLNKDMENYVGEEGLDWWKSLGFIKINKIEDLNYSEDELKRYEKIKNKSQSENSNKLECFIKNIEYVEKEQEELPAKRTKTIEELEEELEEEKKKSKISMLGLMEVNNRLRVLEQKGVK